MRASVCHWILLQLQAALAPEKRLENEAERLKVKQLLLDAERFSATVDSTDSPRSSTSRGGRSISTTGRTAQTSASLKDSLRGSTSSAAAPQAAASQAASIASAAGTIDAAGPTGSRRPPVAPKIPELVSGHYLLDFGCVTKGTNKSRKVKLTNMSTQQVRLQAPAGLLLLSEAGAGLGRE